MMLVASIALMFLTSLVHANVDIAVSQKGADVEFVVSGSINLDGYTSPGCSVLTTETIRVEGDPEIGDEVVVWQETEDCFDADYYSNQVEGFETQGSLAGCSTSGDQNMSVSVNGIFAMYHVDTFFLPGTKITRFWVEDGYVSGSPINVTGRVLEATIDEVFNTPDQFPCTITVPAGVPGETVTVTMRLDPPRTPAPSSLVPISPAPSTAPTPAPSTAVPTPTPASAVTIYGSVFVKIVFPGRSSTVDDSDVEEVGAAVCHYIARYLKWVHRPHDVAVPECTWDVRVQSSNRLHMIFHYTAVISGLPGSKSARNSDLDMEHIVQEYFLEGDIRDELINDLRNLPAANPLSATTSVELADESDEQPDACSLLPNFLQSIPFLGPVLNTVLCFLFGPEGILANLAGLFM